MCAFRSLVFRLLLVVALKHAPLSLGASLSVSPTYFEFEGQPGQSVAQKIVVYNTSTQAQTVRLSSGDFWYNKRFERTFPEVGTSPFSAASWVILKNAETTVEPGSSREVEFVFAIPPQTKPSGYAALFVEQAQATTKPREGVGVSLRIAVPLLFRIKGVALDRTRIKSFSINKPSAYRPLITSTILKNDGDAFTFPEGNLLIVKGEKREFVAKSELKRDRVLLPGQEMKVEMPLTMDSKPGRYSGTLTLFYGNEASTVKNFEFSLP